MSFGSKDHVVVREGIVEGRNYSRRNELLLKEWDEVLSGVAAEVDD